MASLNRPLRSVSVAARVSTASLWIVDGKATASITSAISGAHSPSISAMAFSRASGSVPSSVFMRLKCLVAATSRTHAPNDRPVCFSNATNRAFRPIPFAKFRR